MQSKRRFVSAVPFPFLGYVLGVVGFMVLGVFVAALAGGLSFAPVLGIATAALFAGMATCFRVRAHQIAHSDQDLGLSMDPMRPAHDADESARYLRNYRGADRRPVHTTGSEHLRAA